MGGSAGGLLMGAIVNMRPDMWAGVVAAVPFVDVVTTMLDETIPLTTFEWDEWGDPREKYYDYMKSYSLRQRRGQGLPQHAGDHRLLGQPSAVLGARQVGGPDARAKPTTPC